MAGASKYRWTNHMPYFILCTRPFDQRFSHLRLFLVLYTPSHTNAHIALILFFTQFDSDPDPNSLTASQLYISLSLSSLLFASYISLISRLDSQSNLP
ncbi:hypothetical protein BDR03DRAFT_973960 [Suillus americanus]|nr:hypothetical protein BDR03DRAFT_973960 [Suillus americanus]